MSPVLRTLLRGGSVWSQLGVVSFAAVLVGLVIVAVTLPVHAADPAVEWAAVGHLMGTMGTFAALYLGAIVLSICRVVAFHPFYRKDYRQWLTGTPFNGTQPLPFGPVNLGWIDAAIFLAIVAITFLLSWALAGLTELISLSTIASAACLPYIFLVIYALVRMGALLPGYGLAYGFLAAALLPPGALLCIALAVLAWCAGLAARRELPRYDSAMDPGLFGGAPIQVDLNTAKPLINPDSPEALGWPWPVTASRKLEHNLDKRHGVLLAGWIAGATLLLVLSNAGYDMENPPPFMATSIAVTFPAGLTAIVVSVALVGTYLLGIRHHGTRRSFSERIQSGRLIDPRHDIVYLPFVIVFFLLWTLAGSPPLHRAIVIFPAGLASIPLLYAFVMPHLGVFRLTAPCNIVPRNMDTTKFTRL